MIDYLSRRENPYKGMIIFGIPRDGYGEYFTGGNRYVCFDHQELVGEFTTSTQANLAFLRGDRVPNGIELRHYLGVPEIMRK